MSDRDLIAAYLDGVTELSSDERRRVEALLADDPDAAAEADATRAMLGQLRALPPPSGEPDFRALRDAIGKDLPASRPRSRTPIYAGLALAAMAVAYLATRTPEPPPTQAALATHVEPATTVVADSSRIWLGDDDDATDLDLDADQTLTAIDELFPEDDDAAPDPFGGQFGARIDALDDAAMDRVEHWLEKG